MRKPPTTSELEDRKYWDAEAKRILKAELTRRGKLYKTLADQLSTEEVQITEGMLKAKINRGTFSFGFFLKVMRALGAPTVDISRK